MRRSKEEIFWSKVLKTPTCWFWFGETRNNYGIFRTNNKKTSGVTYAHRFSYILKYGEIPEGLHIDHICENKLCVNPDHLQAITQKRHNRIHIYVRDTKKGKTYAL